MNNFGNYIHGIRKSNKKLFASKKITLTIDSLEKELEKAYNSGYTDSNSSHDKKSTWEKIFGLSLFDSTSAYMMSQSEIKVDEELSSKKTTK